MGTLILLPAVCSLCRCLKPQPGFRVNSQWMWLICEKEVKADREAGTRIRRKTENPGTSCSGQQVRPAQHRRRGGRTDELRQQAPGPVGYTNPKLKNKEPVCCVGLCLVTFRRRRLRSLAGGRGLR